MKIWPSRVPWKMLITSNEVCWNWVLFIFMKHEVERIKYFFFGFKSPPSLILFWLILHKTSKSNVCLWYCRHTYILVWFFMFIKHGSVINNTARCFCWLSVNACISLCYKWRWPWNIGRHPQTPVTHALRLNTGSYISSSRLITLLLPIKNW